MEKENIFFAEEKKNGEEKGGRCLEKEILLLAEKEEERHRDRWVQQKITLYLEKNDLEDYFSTLFTKTPTSFQNKFQIHL